MPEGVIKTIFEGDPSGLLGAMQKLEDKVDKQKEMLGELAKDSGKAYGALAKHLGISSGEAEKLDSNVKKSTVSLHASHGVIENVVGSTLKWASATLSVATAMQAVNDAQRRQKEIADASIDAAEREARARENLGRNLGFDPQEVRAADAKIRRIQQEFGIADKVFVTEAFAAAQAEVPDDQAAAEELVRSAAKFSARNPQDMQATVEAFGNLKRVFGDRTVEEREGFLANIMKMSPITDVANEARKVLPLAEILQENVDLKKITKEQAAAEHIAYQHQMMRLMGDKTGETSAEQMVRLTGRLAQIFEADQELRKIDPGGTRARMEALQNRNQLGMLEEWAEKAQQDLMAKGLGEAKARQAVQSLLTGKHDAKIDAEIGALTFDAAIAGMNQEFREKDPVLAAVAQKGRSEAKKHEEELGRLAVQGQKSLADIEFKRFKDAYSAEHPILGDLTEWIDDWTIGWTAGGTPVGQMRNMQRKINATLTGEKRAREMWGADKERDALIATAEDVLEKLKGFIATAEQATREAQEATAENQRAVAELAGAAAQADMDRQRQRRQNRP